MNTPESPAQKNPGNSGSVSEVFTTFLKLGLSSFGGPIAHLGYFRSELVERRKWVGEVQFAHLLALCQFLPGPASSQLGFSLGLLRAGWAGALAAFIAFTFPSAVLLFAFAALLPHISGAIGDAMIHGLKLVALAVVSQGVIGMTRQLCPDATRLTIATLVAAVILIFGHAWMQIFVVMAGAVAGLVLCRGVRPLSAETLSLPYGARAGGVLLMFFALLLFGLPLVAHGRDGLLAIATVFYRSGALVFGGGHVVLPLLEEALVKPELISSGDFLAGYGAAQAVPGPMFTLAAYLGARMPGAMGGMLGATVALGMIFLPGFLLVAGVLPFWTTIAHRPNAARAVAGINAAVVGILGAALYNPVWTSAVRGPVDVAIALVGLVLLVAWRVSPLLVVSWCVAASAVSSLLPY